MRDYVIVTDSTCDLPMETLKKYNIHVSLLSVLYEGKQFKNYPDGREIDNHTLYQAMREKKTPTTSAANVQDFIDVMEPIAKEGKDILYIGFSSTMSCTYNVGCNVASTLMDQYPECCIVTVDSLSASLGLGLLVLMTAIEKENGASLVEAKIFAETHKLNMAHSFTVNNLFHIMRGGRVTKKSAIFGSLLAVKPILRVDENGLMSTALTAHGRKKALRELVENIRENVIDSEVPFFVGHGDCEAEAQIFANTLRTELGLKNVIVEYIGPVCGCHGGPDLIGAFYYGKSRDFASSALKTA